MKNRRDFPQTIFNMYVKSLSLSKLAIGIRYGRASIKMKIMAVINNKGNKMKKVHILVGLIALIGAVGNASAACKFYEKISGINYRGNPDGAKYLGLIDSNKIYEKISGVSYRGNPDGAKHAITVSSECDATQTMAALSAYLLMIKDDE